MPLPRFADRRKPVRSITPCLWFDANAEEAVRFYTSVLPRTVILETARYGEGAPLPAGTALTVRFKMAGQEFLALNGGPRFPFTPAVSFVLNCESQEEIDRYWALLSDGGEESQCGWLKDRYGLSWQVVPASLGAMLTGSDRAAAARTMAAILTMKKLDLAALERAYRGD
jgi:predicted 3-demethylubiquinone-9 3-methyltransferase (glyoxalase superfamily)